MEKITLTETKTGYINQWNFFIDHSFDDQPCYLKEGIVCGKKQAILVIYNKDHKLHRENNKPALISYSTTEPNKIIEEQYRINGKYHRTNGPALWMIDYHDCDEGDYSEHYYLFGKHVSKEEFYTPGFVDSFILEHS